jgi:hypothetical protein
VTLIQRFGSALNLNIHFQMLFLDGVSVTTGERLTHRRVPPPSVAALEKLVHGIIQRVGRALERQGLLVRDVENSFLTLDRTAISGFDDLLSHSITYRTALGPLQGRKVFTLQTVPAVTDDHNSTVAKSAGLLRASCPSSCGPACGCSKSLLAILSRYTQGWRAKQTNARS